MIYGALTLTDIGVLEAVLRKYQHGPLKLLEVGIHTGSTARGIRDFCETHNIRLDYIGVDSGAQSDCTPPFTGARIIKGDSAEVFGEVDADLDVAFIDGCHCGNHVILDAIHFGNRVKSGGWMLFHDTAPAIAQTMKEPHGPNIPWFHNSVLEGLRAMDFGKGWTLEMDEFEPGTFGGMRAYRKSGERHSGKNNL